MLRFAPLLLVFALVACDTSTSPSPGSLMDTPAPFASASGKEDANIHPVTETVAVGATKETVTLYIRGEAVELQPGEAYLLGEMLSRVGDDVAATMGRELPLPSGGDRCEPPQGGQGVAVMNGWAFDKCPPRPRPPRGFAADELDFLLGGRIKVIEAPPSLDWEPTVGGFRARL